MMSIMAIAFYHLNKPNKPTCDVLKLVKTLYIFVTIVFDEQSIAKRKKLFILEQNPLCNDA